MTQELYDELNLVYSMAYEYRRYFLPNMNKLYSTKICSRILEAFEDKMKSKKNLGKEEYFDNELRLLLFSGHDDNIWPFMRNLGITSPECLFNKYNEIYVEGKKNIPKEDPKCRLAPEFASSVIFELNYNSEGENSNGTFYVRVRYNGSYLNLTDKCKNTKDTNYCPFSEFKSWMENDFILDPASFIKVCRPV